VSVFTKYGDKLR